MHRTTTALILLSTVSMLLGCEGSTWHVPEGWERVHPAFDAPVHDLVRDPRDPRKIFAACAWQNGDAEQRRGGILRSLDHGMHWYEANRGLESAHEISSLASIPAGFLAIDNPHLSRDVPALLTGTRGSGIYASTDGGTSWHRLPERQDGPGWERLTLQTFAVLPGEPIAVAVGTKEYGVFVSEDGGLTWQNRVRGLTNLAIEELVVDASGNLLAAAWYGGIYRSDDRGRSWSSLSPRFERAAISTLAAGSDGSLWMGLQNGGLFVAPPGVEEPPSFEPHGEGAIRGGGVLAIRPRAGSMVVGTIGRGVVLGRRGGRFVSLTKGLENTTVSAVLPEADSAGSIVIGTWGGLYRSIPPRPLTPTLTLALAGLSLAIALAFVSWRRSIPAAVSRFHREMSRRQPDELVDFWGRAVPALPEEKAPAILRRLATRMSGSRNEVQICLAEFVEGTADLLEAYDAISQRIDSASRARVANCLETRARIFETAVQCLSTLDDTAQLVLILRCGAHEYKLFARFLRAESIGHLAVLRDELIDFEQLTSDPRVAWYFDPVHHNELRSILDIVEQLGRMPSAEDRALYLAQALSRTLAILDVHQHREQPATLRQQSSEVVLESVRELLTTALQDIHQRAELKVTLHTKVLTTQREAVVVLELENVGQGHARNIAVELQSDEGFKALRRRREVRSLLRNQSARLEFLVEPRVSDRVRLRFEIDYDDLERQGHRREFADMVEFRQIGQLRSFRPLRPNPYVVGRPLTASDVFSGREDIFDSLQAGLVGARQDNVVVLMGPRRMGKTSILCRLPEHLRDTHVPVLIDLQGMIGSGESAFFRELAATLHDELDELGYEVEEPPPELFERDPGNAFRRHFLKAVRQALGERRLLLLFDEFEVLEARIRCGDLEPRILPYFRSLVQHEKNLSFVFAGTHRLDELTRDYWGVLFNLAIYLEVGHLPRRAVEELFVEPTREFFEIDPLALDKAFQLTGGHPHFSQLLARELVELRNQRRLSYVTIQDLNTVADRVVEKGQLHISYLWEDGSRAERLLLLALKELLDRTGIATLSAAQKYLDQHRIKTTDLTVALRQLLRREIVTDNTGLLAFRIELLRLWLDRHHDLEAFLLSEDQGRES